jgi:hypothetical protein
MTMIMVYLPDFCNRNTKGSSKLCIGDYCRFMVRVLTGPDFLAKTLSIVLIYLFANNEKIYAIFTSKSSPVRDIHHFHVCTSNLPDTSSTSFSFRKLVYRILTEKD